MEVKEDLKNDMIVVTMLLKMILAAVVSEHLPNEELGREVRLQYKGDK